MQLFGRFERVCLCQIWTATASRFGPPLCADPLAAAEAVLQALPVRVRERLRPHFLHQAGEVAQAADWRGSRGHPLGLLPARLGYHFNRQ